MVLEKNALLKLIYYVLLILLYVRWSEVDKQMLFMSLAKP
jgi:hypothetical protein